MKAPIYVYYELDKFYQNHRRYVASPLCLKSCRYVQLVHQHGNIAKPAA